MDNVYKYQSWLIVSFWFFYQFLQPVVVVFTCKILKYESIVRADFEKFIQNVFLCYHQIVGHGNYVLRTELGVKSVGTNFE